MEEKFTSFKNRLAKVFRHLGRQAKRQQVGCYRLYDHDLPEFPFCIEIYDKYVYVAEYKRRHGLTDDEHAAWLSKSVEVIIDVLSVTIDAIYLKLRHVKEGRKGQYLKAPVIKNEFIVTENGLQFIVNLSEYLDTGLFLDHRLTRSMVKSESPGKNVLNLFCYTGSFSVYAAAGGAAEVTSIDLSNTYLSWSERNMQLNGFTNSHRYKYLRTDVLQYLEKIPEEHFELIVLDPPTFSNSQRMNDFLDIQRDHARLINQCLKGLKQGGMIYFSTNAQRFNIEKDKIETANIMDISEASAPFDFQGRLKRVCFKIVKE